MHPFICRSFCIILYYMWNKKLILHLHFPTSLKRDSLYKILFIDRKEHNLPSITALACSKRKYRACA